MFFSPINLHLQTIDTPVKFMYSKLMHAKNGDVSPVTKSWTMDIAQEK